MRNRNIFFSHIFPASQKIRAGKVQDPQQPAIDRIASEQERERVRQRDNAARVTVERVNARVRQLEEEIRQRDRIARETVDQKDKKISKLKQNIQQLANEIEHLKEQLSVEKQKNSSQENNGTSITTINPNIPKQIKEIFIQEKERALDQFAELISKLSLDKNVDIDKEIEFTEEDLETAKKRVQRYKIDEITERLESLKKLKELRETYKELIFKNDTIPFALQQIFSKLTSIESGSLAIIEYPDVDFKNAERISSKGCNGVAGKVKIHSGKLANRTLTSYTSNEEIAIKMMYNYNANQGNEKETLFQKIQFDKEYCFPLAHPHWSHVKVFNSFRGRICAALLPDPSMDCLVDRTTYFTMELCKSNLQNYIDDHKGSISNSEGILIIFQILIGIKHLYSKNVVHLDLKPDNILITNRKNINGFQVVIGDFGTLNPFLYTEQVASNIAYRAPELFDFDLIRKDPVDIRNNDVWAAGCILFELLTGEHPFSDQEHPNDTEANICHGVLPLNKPQFVESTKQLLKLLWNRNSKERIQPKIAVGVCGVLLFGCPSSSFSVDGKEWSSSDLENNESFKSFCADCKNISESICENWLNRKKFTIFETFKSFENKSVVDIKFILELYVVLKTPSRLFESLQIFSQISYP